MPGKCDPEAQKTFLENTLNPLIDKAKRGVMDLFFVDASHFVFGGFSGKLWSKIRCWVKTPCGRQRHNVLGALNFMSKKIEIITTDTYITSTQVVNLLELIVKKYSGRTIALVLDNARYQRCKLVQLRAAQLGVQLVFLPPYSPNLNLIERFWKLLKSRILSANPIESFSDFSITINNFIMGAHIKHKADMHSLLRDRFQLFDQNPSLSHRNFH